MSRTATMATGFFLILAGIQLHFVESFTMTPRISHFMNDNFSQPFPYESPLTENFVTSGSSPAPGQDYNSPYYQASYSQPNRTQFASSRSITSVGSQGQSVRKRMRSGLSSADVSASGFLRI